MRLTDSCSQPERKLPMRQAVQSTSHLPANCYVQQCNSQMRPERALLGLCSHIRSYRIW